MKLVNLTPHDVTIINDDGEVLINLPPSGVVARAHKERERIFQIYTDCAIIPVNETRLGEVSDLPDMQDNTFYVVSYATYEAAGRRPDLYVVDESVRNGDGKTVGCRALARPI